MVLINLFLPFFFFLSNENALAPVDVGTPPIYAICKIELLDGAVEEGMICIVEGGYNGIRKNGFSIKKPGQEFFEHQFFTVEDYSLNLGSYTARMPGKEESPVFFMKAMPNEPREREISYDPQQKIYSVKSSYTYHYKMMTSFYIYAALDQQLHLPAFSSEESISGSSTEIQKKKIDVANIKHFELVAEPKEKWISYLKKAKAGFKKGPEPSDYVPPFWYHEIRKNPEEFLAWKIQLSGKRRIETN